MFFALSSYAQSNAASFNDISFDKENDAIPQYPDRTTHVDAYVAENGPLTTNADNPVLMSYAIDATKLQKLVSLKQTLVTKKAAMEVQFPAPTEKIAQQIQNLENSIIRVQAMIDEINQ